MILINIKHYLKQKKQATLTDIALHVNAEKEAVQGMLDVLIRRKEITLGQISSACQSSCSQCDSAITALYFWGSKKSCQNEPIKTDWS